MASAQGVTKGKKEPLERTWLKSVIGKKFLFRFILKLKLTSEPLVFNFLFFSK